MNDETPQTDPEGTEGSTRTEPAGPEATATDPPPPLPPGPRPRPPRRLRRAPDSPLGGVATGIANYFDITPLVIQVAFVATTALSGFGALAYVACWFLIPTPSDPETRPVTITSDTTRAVLGVLFAIAAASVTFTLGPNTFEITLLPILLVAAGFYLLNQRNEQSRRPADIAPDPTIGTAGDTTDAMWAESSTSAHWATIDPEVDQSVPPEPPGPPVTSVTLAVAAVAVGLLLTIGQFGPTVSSAAVFGTALAILGGGLVYGAFRGRPRGLVPLGLLLVIGLALAPAFDAFASGGTGPREYSPVNEADVLDIYDLGAGPMELDLRRVEFTEDRTIEVNVGAGYAEIWLPSDVDVRVDAEVTAGYIELFGRENAGIRTDATASRSGEPGSPTITLETDVTFGYVEVRRG